MIVLALTFLVNLIVVTVGLRSFQYVTPLHIPWLEEVFRYMGWAYTPDNSSLALAVSILTISAIFAQTRPMQWFLCRVNGCVTAGAEERRYLERIMEIVTERSNLRNENFHLYVSNMKAMNAFAIGSNNICVTRVMLQTFPARYIAGILAHEMGHIVHRDTAYGITSFAFSWVGQSIILIYVMTTRILQILLFIPIVNFIVLAVIMMINVQLFLFTFLLNLPLNMMSFFDSRKREYAADRYACEIGLGNELYEALYMLSQNEVKLSGWQRLQSTHPATPKRLEKIKKYLNMNT